MSFARFVLHLLQVVLQLDTILLPSATLLLWYTQVVATRVGGWLGQSAHA
jgi:hypothetical protein